MRTRLKLTGVGAALVAMIVVGVAAAAVSYPPQSSSISGGCTANPTASPFSTQWDEDNVTGEAVTFADLPTVVEPNDPGAAVSASGNGREGSVEWETGWGGRGSDPNDASWWDGKSSECHSNDHTFTNTFVVEALEGPGLADGDPVTLELVPSVAGSARMGRSDGGRHGQWVAQAETSVFFEVYELVDATTDEWLASTDARSRADIVSNQFGTSNLAWSQDGDWNWTNNLGEDSGDSSDGSVVCASYGTGSCTYGEIGLPTPDVRSVLFQTTVGARVTVMGYIAHFAASDSTEIGNPLAEYVFSTGDLTVGFDVTPPVSGGVRVVWEGGSEPPPVVPEGYIEADQALGEGDSGSSAMVFTVALSEPTTVPVTVNWRTEDGTASSSGTNADYTPQSSGSVTFAAGDVSEEISIQILGDTIDENDETFDVVLSNASGATIASAEPNGVATGTIVDDDDAPTVAQAIADLKADLGPLSSSLRHALGVKLDEVLAAYQAGNTALACDKLTAFVNQVKAKIGKGITPGQATDLLAQAAAIRTMVGC